jgi:uncharacterized membrane protein YdjX (TVP38/TMEM64 family)
VRVRIALIAVTVVVLVLLFRTIWDREAFMSALQDAPPIPFFAIMALLPVVGVPLTPLLIAAGATFGARLGVVGSLLALAVNLALSYRIARSGLRPSLTRLFERFDYELPNFDGQPRNALRFTLMVKFAPGVPAFVKNYGLGVAGVPFTLYFVTSMLITGVYSALLVVLGESIFTHETNHLVWAGGALLLVAVAVYLWRKRSSGRGGAAAVGGSA